MVKLLGYQVAVVPDHTILPKDSYVIGEETFSNPKENPDRNAEEE